LRALARGAVLGARGNSGVIVAQLLRGLADAVGDSRYCDARAFQQALSVACVQAYGAVAEPLEGTILTVARGAADAAAGVRSSPAQLASVVAAAVAGAAEALRGTPQQLPVLARAGVVDAGGRGLLVVLRALADVVGVPAETEPASRPDARPEPGRIVSAPSNPHADDDHDGAVGGERYRYEVQYLLDAAPARVAELRAELGALGGSLSVVGNGEAAPTWNVHVHVDEVGPAIEAGVRAGRPHRISVVRFDDQRVSPVSAADQSGPGRVATSAVVAVAPGAGLAHLFQAGGAAVVESGPDGLPDVAAVVAAVRATGAMNVVLLPNAAHPDHVAERAADQARLAGVTVAVVPTRSPLQGLAAVAVHDPGRRFGDDVVAMAEAAAATRWAELTVADGPALTSVGACQAGDVLGLIDGEVVQIGETVRTVSQGLVDRLLAAGGELITVLVGAEAEPADVEALRAHVAAVAPLAELSLFRGGQPDTPLLIGVE
jgi:DAK2 domain fusion protein YloV